jgi:hypothetical protein
MSDYIYREENQVRDPRKALPEGDYAFEVIRCQEPTYSKSGRGNLVLTVTLQINVPTRDQVMAWPWAGTTSSGEVRDGIGEFLRAVNCAPKSGTEPDWDRIIGAKGRCHLRVETVEIGAFKGIEQNKVDYFHTPKAVGPGAGETKWSKTEYAELTKKSVPKQEDDEPEDIPF